MFARPLARDCARRRAVLHPSATDLSLGNRGPDVRRSWRRPLLLFHSSAARLRVPSAAHLPKGHPAVSHAQENTRPRPPPPQSACGVRCRPARFRSSGAPMAGSGPPIQSAQQREEAVSGQASRGGGWIRPSIRSPVAWISEGSRRVLRSGRFTRTPVADRIPELGPAMFKNFHRARLSCSCTSCSRVKLLHAGDEPTGRRPVGSAAFGSSTPLRRARR